MRSLFGAIGRGVFTLEASAKKRERVDDVQVLEIPINSQEFELPTIRVWQLQRQSACLSYVIISQRRAIVIDPVGDVYLYQKLIKHTYAQIAYVLDTHLHSDHVSSGEELAVATEARYLSPVTMQAWLDNSSGWPEFVLRINDLVMHAMATPGHTLESLSFILANVAFTGDLFSLEGVGKAELRNGNVHKQAMLLWQSMSHMLNQLPATTLILPAHAAMIELGSLREILRPLLMNPTFFVEEIVEKAKASV